jgi:hypothetical protein
MIQYVCDCCSRVKAAEETWILGFAVESRGITAASREFTMAPNWNERRAREWLAVHFCSHACKDDYMSKLFGREPAESEITQSVSVVRSDSSHPKVVSITRRQRRVANPAAAPERRRKKSS